MSSIETQLPVEPVTPKTQPVKKPTLKSITLGRLKSTSVLKSKDIVVIFVLSIVKRPLAVLRTSATDSPCVTIQSSEIERLLNEKTDLFTPLCTVLAKAIFGQSYIKSLSSLLSGSYVLADRTSLIVPLSITEPTALKAVMFLKSKSNITSSAEKELYDTTQEIVSSNRNTLYYLISIIASSIVLLSIVVRFVSGINN